MKDMQMWGHYQLSSNSAGEIWAGLELKVVAKNIFEFFDGNLKVGMITMDFQIVENGGFDLGATVKFPFQLDARNLFRVFPKRIRRFSTIGRE